MQARPQDPLHPIQGRRLDRPGPALGQQLVPDECVTVLLLRMTARQPPGELVGVNDRALPEPEVRPDFRPVPLTVRPDHS